MKTSAFQAKLYEKSKQRAQEEIRLIELAFSVIRGTKNVAAPAEDIAEGLRLTAMACERLRPKYDPKLARRLMEAEAAEKERIQKKKERNDMHRAEAKKQAELEIKYYNGDLPRPPSISEKLNAAVGELKASIKREVYSDIFDTLKIRGKPIGGIWHHELRNYKTESAFEAALCGMLLDHAQPATACRVRDLVSVATLADMVGRARADTQYSNPAQRAA